ncbi:MAG: 30S ribosome-binding factor RbfA [Bacteroidota bacterium]
MSIRTERVASLLKQEIGNILLQEFAGPGLGLITVTDVKMSADLRIARVFFSVLGSPETVEKTCALLDQEKQHLRGRLAAAVRLRYVPSLQFHRDDTGERAERIHTLIRKIHDGTTDDGPAT